MMQNSSFHPTLPWRIPRRVGAAIVLAISVLAGAIVATPAVAAEDDHQWDVGTVDGPFGSGRQNFEYALEPGDRLEDGFVVVNNGDTALDLALYAADAFTTETGQLDLRTRDHVPSGLGNWLEVEQDRISLQPGESDEIPFSVCEQSIGHW